MQVDGPRHGPPRSLRAFAGDYAMIVLSILTALALERVAVAWQNVQAAQTSRTRIEAELARDLDDLRSAERTNLLNIKTARTLLRALIERLRTGQSMDAATTALLQPMWQQHFGISTNSWQRSAWDAAIADQSASHLSSADLTFYAQIYATGADAQATGQLMMSGEWMTQFADQNLDIILGKPDVRSLANSLARFLLAAQQIESDQAALIALVVQHRSEHR